MRKKHCILGSKKGSSLIELVVSMLISSMMLLMVTASVGPVAKITLRMQELQLAQEIIENISTELKAQAADAVSYVKIYSDGTEAGIVGKTGSDVGTALEYQNLQGYIEVLSTDGCPETNLVRGGQPVGNMDKIDAGRFINRYYFPATDNTYEFKDTSGVPVARAIKRIFTDKFYMDHYVKITYSYPAEGSGGYRTEGEPGNEETYLNYIVAEISLYDDKEMTSLVTTEKVILDFRYKINRSNEETAVEAP